MIYLIHYYDMLSSCKIKTYTFVSCALLMSFLYARIGYALGSYYLDSSGYDRSKISQTYEKSETYAAAVEDKYLEIDDTDETKKKQKDDVKVVKIAPVVKFDNVKNQQGRGVRRTINNTILIKTSSKKKEKKEKVEKPAIVPAMREVKIEEKPKKDNKPQKLDKWYAYAFLGYGMTMPSGIVGSPISIYLGDQRYNGVIPICHSFNIGLGIKFYSSIFFIAPEFTYHLLTGKIFSNAFESNLPIIREQVNTTNMTQSEEVIANLYTRFKSNYFFTFDLRLGMLLFKSFAVYAKGSVGALSGTFSYYTGISDDKYVGASDFVKAQYDNIKQKNRASLTSLGGIYGFGGGVEMNFYNHHFFIRLEYEYFLVPKTSFSLSDSMKRQLGLSNALYKMNFHLVSISFGGAF